jgi:hypothetical protein
MGISKWNSVERAGKLGELVVKDGKVWRIRDKVML